MRRQFCSAVRSGAQRKRTRGLAPPAWYKAYNARIIRGYRLSVLRTYSACIASCSIIFLCQRRCLKHTIDNSNNGHVTFLGSRQVGSSMTDITAQSLSPYLKEYLGHDQSQRSVQCVRVCFRMSDGPRPRTETTGARFAETSAGEAATLIDRPES